MGEGESARTDRPFHIMNAVERIRPKLRSCAAACRGFWRKESMVEGVFVSCGRLLIRMELGGVWICAEKRFSGVADAPSASQRY